MPASPPLPFTHAALRAALSERCLAPSTWRSGLHLALDLAALAGLYALSLQVASPVLWVPLAFLQGTFLWALFVIGHDCGHGSFSRHAWLNEWIGHLCHTPLLVPYHAWRLSHRIHHRRAGDLERDEGWFPLTEAQHRALPRSVRWLRTRGLFLVFPLYLLRRAPERAGSHYDARDAMFPAQDRARVRRSVRACALFAAGLGAFAVFAGPGAVARFWVLPWLVACGWIAVVTYLHHSDEAVPWYRGAGWSWLHGALSTTDRRYGPFERLHHDAGCHVVHHLFPAIPHYRLREAAALLRPLLGEHYLLSRESVPRALWRRLRWPEVVPAEGHRVYAAPLVPPRPAEAPPARGSARSGAGSSPATT